MTTRTQWVRNVADSHRNRSILQRLSFMWPRKVSLRPLPPDGMGEQGAHDVSDLRLASTSQWERFQPRFKWSQVESNSYRSFRIAFLQAVASPACKTDATSTHSALFPAKWI